MPACAAAPGGRRIDAEQRIGGLDRRVGTECEPRAGPLERPPRIRACGDAGPVLFRQLAIGHGVDRLHGCDHADACEPLHVFGVDALRVLDAGPPETPRLAMRFERVESPPYRAVTDGVQADVELSAGASADHVDEIRLAESRGAGSLD